MGCNPAFSRLYPLNGESSLRGYDYGVKILDYEGMNERLDRMMELRSLESAKEHEKQKTKELRDVDYKIIEQETEEYPPKMWQYLVRYWMNRSPEYCGEEEVAYFWGVISSYTEPFYVYVCPDQHKISDLADLDNEKSYYNQYDYVYRVEADNGEVTVTKCRAEIVEEEVVVEDFDVDEDDVDEW